MFRAIRLVLLLIFLSISLTIIFPHGQEWWYNHPDMGWFGSLRHEWKIARWPMVGAVIVAVLVVIWEYTSSHRDDKREAARDAMLRSMDDTLKKILARLEGNDGEPKSG